MLSVIATFLTKHWLAFAVGAAILGGILWVNGLRSTIREQKAEIVSLQVELKSVAEEAKKQADAFTLLQKVFEDYQKIQEEYIKTLGDIRQDQDDLTKAIRDLGTEEERNKPLSPYLKRLLERLAGGSP